MRKMAPMRIHIRQKMAMVTSMALLVGSLGEPVTAPDDPPEAESCGIENAPPAVLEEAVKCVSPPRLPHPHLSSVLLVTLLFGVGAGEVWLIVVRAGREGVHGLLGHVVGKLRIFADHGQRKA